MWYESRVDEVGNPFHLAEVYPLWLLLQPLHLVLNGECHNTTIADVDLDIRVLSIRGSSKSHTCIMK